MNFFEHQSTARRNTSLLVFYYILAVIIIVAAVYFAIAAVIELTMGNYLQVGSVATIFEAYDRGETDIGTFVFDHSESVPSYFERLWSPRLFLLIGGITLTVIGFGSVYKILALAKGGETVATLLGGRRVDPVTQDFHERRLLNVVEEMAIASGVAVPPVFLLNEEDGINAFAAGFGPNDAIIAVTKGCAQLLTRDELQGVIAHEFSHIFNGDMRLNIRLMGVLNGILIVALAGYWITRASLGSGRYASRSHTSRRGLHGSILLLGISLAVVGYIGVFFGKLIKSAVSRQREFLADASAVQFTRNPNGITGALKKIGGFLSGSRIGNPSAEEASHLFFSDGLAKTFFHLMATHPPLPERIRRIDPAFDGKLDTVTPEAVRLTADDLSSRFMEEGGEEVQQLAGAVESARRFAIDPKEVVSRVGQPQLEHLIYAGQLLLDIPPMVMECVHQPCGALAVVYNLLLDINDDIRDIQLRRLFDLAGDEVYRETLRIMPRMRPLGDELRLPLVDLVVPTLQNLSVEQYETFRGNVEYLVQADREFSLFEHTLLRVLTRHLDPIYGRVQPQLLTYKKLEAVTPNCVDLLLALAKIGHRDPDQAKQAFAEAFAVLSADEPTDRYVSLVPSVLAVDRALSVLAQASPEIKAKVIEASVVSIAFDGKVTIEEAELLRAIGDSLDCPIPPFLPQQAV